MHFIIGANIADSLTTGMGRQMHGLGGALARRGHRVDYLFEDVIGTDVGRRFSRLTAPVRAAREIAMIRPEGGTPPIAILHEPIGWPTAVFLRRRVRTIAMVHNCEMKCWGIKLKTRADSGDQVAARSRILWPVTELSQTCATLKTAAAVFCLSSEDQAFIRDRVRVPVGRIERIDNGIEPPFLGLPFNDGATERDILFLGSWLPHKGIRTLLAALETLSSRGIQAKLTLAGTGAFLDTIRGAIPERWRVNTEIVPHVPPENLIEVYRQHRIFLLPSITEGIPLAMLEAMACGLCPIVSEVGGVIDVLRSGSTGWLVPALDPRLLADALAHALQAPDETRRLARAAHAMIQSYGWDRVAAQVERFCEARFSSAT